MRFGWECENAPTCRKPGFVRLEARGRDDAHPAFLVEPPLTCSFMKPPHGLPTHLSQALSGATEGALGLT